MGWIRGVGRVQGWTREGDSEGERGERVHGWGPNVVWVLGNYSFPVSFTNHLSLGCKLRANTPTPNTASHCSQGGAPPTRRHPCPRATARGVEPLLCHREHREPLSLPAPPHLLQRPHIDAAASNCSQGGSLRDNTHAREQLLAGWGRFCVTRNREQRCRSLAYLSGYDGPTTTLPRASARGMDPSPGPDDALSSSSTAPVLEEARNCGSSQMQEL